MYFSFAPKKNQLYYITITRFIFEKHAALAAAALFNHVHTYVFFAGGASDTAASRCWALIGPLVHESESLFGSHRES